METSLFRLNDDLKGLWMNAWQESGAGRKAVASTLGEPMAKERIDMETAEELFQKPRETYLDAPPKDWAHAMANTVELHLVVMAAACIEARENGAEAGMTWIKNTLYGPGLIPSRDFKDAQAYFDRFAPSIEARCYIKDKGEGVGLA